MKLFTPILTLVLALSGISQRSIAQDHKPAKKEAEKKVSGLELGAKLPELKITNQYGKEIPLAAAKGDRWVFVFFYPKALTGG